MEKVFPSPCSSHLDADAKDLWDYQNDDDDDEESRDGGKHFGLWVDQCFRGEAKVQPTRCRHQFAKLVWLQKTLEILLARRWCMMESTKSGVGAGQYFHVPSRKPNRPLTMTWVMQNKSQMTCTLDLICTIARGSKIQLARVKN